MDLLLYLIAHRARFVSKDEIQEGLWKAVVVGQASLPRLVKELRRALGDRADCPRYVRTLHGRGYQFVAELDEAPDAARAAAASPSSDSDRDATSPAALTRETADRATLFLWMLDPDAGACSAFPL